MTALERDVQREIVTLFRGLGCRVYSLSQARRSNQTAGLPDLWVFCPRKHVGFWFEVKAAWGKPSEEQETFADSCRVCRVHHAIGGLAEARTLAKALGLMWEAA